MKYNLQILIYTANRTNSKAAASLAKEAGLDYLVCRDIDMAIEWFDRAGALLLEAETLTSDAMEKLNRALDDQPPWSALPIILLTDRYGQYLNEIRERIGQSYILVNQPLNGTSLISLLRMALNTRQRQYELKNLLEEMHRLNADLEKRVDEQTAELRKRAEHAEKFSRELERSNRDLEEFAHSISHDLQEPLRMISSFLTLFARRYKRKLDSDADKYIYYAVNGADRMHSMIKSLLEYSLVGNDGMNPEEVDCNEAVEQVITLLAPDIEGTEAQVSHDPLPTIFVDRIQLEQVFHNLIDNGLKFRDKQPPAIHVSATERQEEWEFAIRDNGIGIDPEHIDRIFNIFQQLHARDKYSGNGIGLAICKKIVQRHGGSIWAESEPGRGSTFYFTLPKESGKNQ